jgi:rSAM/selenodomain-associated transferase 2
MQFSIVIPVLNEAASIGKALLRLREQTVHTQAEIIVVDAGSSDDTQSIAKAFGARVLTAARGRASQQNKGAAVAVGDVLLFLHADTVLPENALEDIARGFETSSAAWGRFDVRLDSDDVRLKVVAAMMNWRSRVTGIATGDQCIFVKREVFQRVGGFADLALMEDIDLSKRLKRVSPPLCVTSRALTSARRWRANGVVRTVLLMWWLRFAYWIGISPQRLARWYGYGRTK